MNGLIFNVLHAKADESGVATEAWEQVLEFVRRETGPETLSDMCLIDCPTVTRDTVPAPVAEAVSVVVAAAAKEVANYGADSGFSVELLDLLKALLAEALAPLDDENREEAP